MNLPSAPGLYDPDDQARLRRALTAADRLNLKLREDIVLTEARLVIASPDGNLWKIEVSNAGAITATAYP